MDFVAFSLLLLTPFPALVWSHARLMSPPSRSSMWRLGFSTPKNFNDNALYCGGISIQWQKNGGRCGICGDPYNMPHPRDNEAGGKYGRGILSKRYRSGQVIEATVDVTTNHRGYFEFKLCPNNNPKKEATQDCLDKYLLKEAHGTGTRYYIGNRGNGNITVKLQLPKGLTCSQCVFQWTYVAGNNWGKCEDGVSRLGCGPQETFRGCADIAIEKNTDVFNENDVENQHPKDHPEKSKKNGHPKVTTGAKDSGYAHESTKHGEKNTSRTHPENPNRNNFHHQKGSHTPSFPQKPENTTHKSPFSNGRHHYGMANGRKYHKFDNRHFYHHSHHSSNHPSLSAKDISIDINRWPIRNEPNGNIGAKLSQQHSRKRYGAQELGKRYPQALMMSLDSGQDAGFNLGGRRYKDFWLLSR